MKLWIIFCIVLGILDAISRFKDTDDAPVDSNLDNTPTYIWWKFHE